MTQPVVTSTTSPITSPLTKIDLSVLGTGTFLYSTNKNTLKSEFYSAVDASSLDAASKATLKSLWDSGLITFNFDASHTTFTGFTITGTNGADVINGSALNDTIYAGNAGDTINAGAGNDVIVGGNGKDVLIGGRGGDVLTGGNGSDTFKYQQAIDSAVGGRPQVVDSPY